MNADDLDGRIRSLVHDAVAAAPAAPDLPAAMPSAAPVAASPNRGRGWVWAGIGIAASIIAVGVLVLTNRDDDPSIVAGSTSADVSTSVDGTSLPWPDGVAVIVASTRGIEKVTAENGQAVVTRLLSDVSVARAFELEDGSIVYQETGGDIRRLDGQTSSEPPMVAADGKRLDLQDADIGNGDGWRLVYVGPGQAPEDALTLTAHVVPNDPVSYPIPGGFAVGYRRFTIVDDRAVTTATMDDTGQRTGYMVNLRPGEELSTYGLEAASPRPLQQVGDGSGSIGVLDEKGQFTSYGTRSGFTVNLGDPTAVTDLDFRGQWLSVQREGGTSSLVDLLSATAYDVPIADGTVSVSRKERVDTQPVPTTVLTESTTPSKPTPTTVGAPTAEPFPSCLTVTAPTTADVQMGTTFYSVEPIPEETIQVAGRPAVLRSWGGGWGVILRHPDWCTEYGITTNTMSKAEFLAWVGTLSVTETLPASMPPVLVRSNYGLSVIGPYGSKVIARGRVDQAVLLQDGRVVYHSPDLADFQMWDPQSQSSNPIWSAADWIATPVLHDAFGPSFVFSVQNRMYLYDSDQTWDLTGVQWPRVSMFGDGEILPNAPIGAQAVAELGAIEPTMPAAPAAPVSVYVWNHKVVVSSQMNSVMYEDIAEDSDSTYTDVDVNHGWVTICEVPPGDSPPRVTLVDLSTGRTLTLSNVTGAHLG